MNIRFLFPYKLKLIGWIIAVPAFVLMIFNLHYGFMLKFLNFYAIEPGKISFDYNNFLPSLKINNFTDEVGGLLLIIGLLFIAFSKEKHEDERVLKLRLESLLWAVLANSILLILSIILFYGDLFLKIMTYNICTPLILFIIRFNLLMYHERKNLKKETQ